MNFTQLSAAIERWAKAIRDHFSHVGKMVSNEESTLQAHIENRSNPHLLNPETFGAYSNDEIDSKIDTASKKVTVAKTADALRGRTEQDFRDMAGFVNIYKNPAFKTKDDNGNYGCRVSRPGGASVFELKTPEELPPEVLASVPSQFIINGEYPNALHVIIDKSANNWWIPGNTVSGFFSAGWGHCYLVSGHIDYFNPIKGKPYGPVIQHIDRRGRAWHIDAMFGSNNTMEAYLFMPYVVAGYINNIDQVLWTWPNRGRFNGRLAYTD